MFQRNAYGNGLDAGVGDDLLENGPAEAIVMEQDQESRYRDFKDQLLRQKSYF